MVTTALFKERISLFGIPLTITTDQGTQFESVLFAALVKTIGAKRVRTTPYHPAANGLIERWHRNPEDSTNVQLTHLIGRRTPSHFIGTQECLQERY